MYIGLEKQENYFAPAELRSIVMSMSVCLSIYLFVCLSAHITRKLRNRTSLSFYACCL